MTRNNEGAEPTGREQQRQGRGRQSTTLPKKKKTRRRCTRHSRDAAQRKNRLKTQEKQNYRLTNDTTNNQAERKQMGRLGRAGAKYMVHSGQQRSLVKAAGQLTLVEVRKRRQWGRAVGPTKQKRLMKTNMIQYLRMACQPPPPVPPLGFFAMPQQSQQMEQPISKRRNQRRPKRHQDMRPVSAGAVMTAPVDQNSNGNGGVDTADQQPLLSPSKRKASTSPPPPATRSYSQVATQKRPRCIPLAPTQLTVS